MPSVGEILYVLSNGFQCSNIQTVAHYSFASSNKKASMYLNILDLFAYILNYNIHK